MFLKSIKQKSCFYFSTVFNVLFNFLPYFIFFYYFISFVFIFEKAARSIKNADNSRKRLNVKTSLFPFRLFPAFGRYFSMNF